MSTRGKIVDFHSFDFVEDTGEGIEYGDFTLIGKGVKGKRGGCGGGCVRGGAGGASGGGRAMKRNKAKLRGGVVYSAKHVRIQSAKKR